MWEATIRATVEQQVDADPERVWALAAAPAALSAMPGHRFAFAVPAAVPGTDRLGCMIVSGKENVHCAVVDVREEIPGQLISWQVRSAPARKETLTLSVRPRPGGCTLSVAVSEVVPRSFKGSYQRYWRRTADDWARRLQSVAEGDMPWPPDGMPAEMRERCAGFELPEKTGQASASTEIKADAAAVWATVSAPDSARLIDPETFIWAGTVPGTPRRAVGELQCSVTRPSDDRFNAVVHVVTELAEGRREVTQRIGSPDTEIAHLVTPVAGGTRLELTARWPAPAVRKAVAMRAADTIAEHLRATAEAYKESIEKAADPPGEQ
jgi:uncharacterized protein YndB with AHSA1/START domain